MGKIKNDDIDDFEDFNQPESILDENIGKILDRDLDVKIRDIV